MMVAKKQGNSLFFLWYRKLTCYFKMSFSGIQRSTYMSNVQKEVEQVNHFFKSFLFTGLLIHLKISGLLAREANNCPVLLMLGKQQCVNS